MNLTQKLTGGEIITYDCNIKITLNYPPNEDSLITMKPHDLGSKVSILRIQGTFILLDRNYRFNVEDTGNDSISSIVYYSHINENRLLKIVLLDTKQQVQVTSIIMDSLLHDTVVTIPSADIYLKAAAILLPKGENRYILECIDDDENSYIERSRIVHTSYDDNQIKKELELFNNIKISSICQIS